MQVLCYSLTATVCQCCQHLLLADGVMFARTLETIHPSFTDTLICPIIPYHLLPPLPSTYPLSRLLTTPLSSLPLATPTPFTPTSAPPPAVIPHITDAVQEWVTRVSRQPVDDSGRTPQVCVIEVRARARLNHQPVCVGVPFIVRPLTGLHLRV